MVLNIHRNHEPYYGRGGGGGVGGGGGGGRGEGVMVIWRYRC